MDFVKYHGLGNDFAIVDLRQGGAMPDDQTVQAVCQRRFGVGADGILALLPADGVAAQMVVINADGSRPEMCGNGLRCVAAYLTEDQPGHVDVLTDAGVYPCNVALHDGVPWVDVAMGHVSFDPVLAGAHGPCSEGWLELEVAGVITRLYVASTGNPHAICVVTDPDFDLRAAAERLGPALSTHEAFANGANVTWIRPQGQSAQMVVHERGAGLTLACGTGACAAAGVLVKLGFLQADEPARIELPGGPLDITVGSGGADKSGPVVMKGPAQRVFAGRWG